MLIALRLAPEPGSTIADVCAAPGTKTTHLAQLMDDRGRVVAFDPQPARLARIGEAAARLGLTIIDARPGRVEALAGEFRGTCGGVLVGAHYSISGEVWHQPVVESMMTN